MPASTGLDSTSNKSRAEAHDEPPAARILLVDDKPLNLHALEAILEPLGHTTVAVSSGKEALEALLTHDFAVILLDVRMPVQDGLETAAAIKTHERIRHVPIIFLTADGSPDELRRAYEQGASDFLTKPFNPIVLRSKVSVFIELFQRGERLKKQEATLLERERERAALAEAEAARLRLQSERDLLHALIEQNGDGVIVSDARGVLRIFNPAAERQHGVAKPQVAAPEWASTLGLLSLDGSPLPLESTPLHRAMKGHKITSARWKVRRPDGSLRTLTGTATPLRGEGGALVGAVMTTRDETERLELEEQLRDSRSWLSTTLTSIGDGVIATDMNGQITFLNPVAAALTGWTPDEARQRSIEEVFPILNEQTRKRAESPVAKVLREGAALGLANHTILVRRDGSEIPIESSAAPIREPDGGLSGVVLVFRDASEKRRVEVERTDLLAREQTARAFAEESERRFRFVTESMPQLVWTSTPDGSADYTNVRWTEFTGKTREELLGWGWQEALHPDDKARCVALWKEVTEAGSSFEIEVRWRRADGTYRWMLGRALPMRDEQGAVLKWFGTCTDVDEQKRAQEQRQSLLTNEKAARAEAEFASRAKDEFLATASHELRTPLTAILGWARMLRSGRLDPSGYLRAVETIERNARAQVQLIEDILDGSRVITGKLHLEIRPLDLTALVRGALDAVRPAADAKRITLAASLDPAAARVSGDPERLQQVVWNLANNAIKFTPKGGRVEVRLERIGTTVQLTVSDTGQGITAEFLPYVFERFRQAEGSTTRRYGGLGLGLALVRHLVEAHGGTAHAESEGEGKGATFCVKLPVQAGLPDHVVEERATPIPGSGGALVPVESLHGVTVLVVDDEADARELVTAVLQLHGAEVTTADSGKRALELLAKGAPAVLVSDIGMPGEDGYELIRRIRTLGSAELASIPAVALTAYAREEDRRRAAEAGFQAHVAKPVEPSELVRIVAGLVQSD